ncbi:MAG: endonuclease III domain-containing protein [bacterium]|nr:endonuclease III domain-containing protein [bacterium]
MRKPNLRQPLLNPYELYTSLLSHFGPQHWWPAETPFEVVVGTILTQQVAWKNVEKAIENLKNKHVLDPCKMSNLSLEKLEVYVKPTGFYRQKARRLKDICTYIFKEYNSSLKRLFNKEICSLRAELLSLKGIGPETADSIILYAAEKPSFVIDAYTKRICERLQLTHELDYESLKFFFESSIPEDVEVYKEFHALLVELGKNYCKTRPVCKDCPLRRKCKLFCLYHIVY